MVEASSLILIPLLSLRRKCLPFQNNDVIKWKHFPRYWPFVRGIHLSPVKSLHKGQWRGALMFSLICAWINGWVNNGEAGNLRRHRAHYDVNVISLNGSTWYVSRSVDQSNKWWTFFFHLFRVSMKAFQHVNKRSSDTTEYYSALVDGAWYSYATNHFYYILEEIISYFALRS